MKSNRAHIALLLSYPFPIKMLILCFFLLPLFSFATVRYVPSEYSTIQAGIDAAVDGDEIIVSLGTYYENIHFLGKNIILRSTDPTSPTVVASTVIDGNHAGSVVTFSGMELSSCVLSGFTITNGYAPYGGGINGNGTLATIQYNYIESNTVYTSGFGGYGGGLHECNGIIKNNIISGNSASRNGGGLDFCDGTIDSNTISGNSALRSGGGLYDCDGIIQYNTISENLSDDSGGGLQDCDGTIQYNVISDNYTGENYGYGGGLHNCEGIIQNNIISGNRAYRYGGGLWHCDGTIQNNLISANSTNHYSGGGLGYCDGTIQDNIISDNSAKYEGGGFYRCNGAILRNIISGNTADYGGGLFNCDGTIRNSIIWSNTANLDGGGLYDCDRYVYNNTIYGNSALDSGGGLYDCNWSIKNCIIWQNSAPGDPQLYNCVTPGYSCIQDWSGGGTGNISVDPQLADPANGDFHLLPSSPCIDAGWNVNFQFTDFEGDPGGWDGTSEPRGDGSDIDIGADEFIGPTSFDFTSSQEGWTIGTATVFSSPQWVFESGRLKLVSQNNTNTFGYWVSPENAIPATEGYLYRARFIVSTDVALPELVPQIRLRVNSRNFQQADCITIDSNGDGGASPTPEGTTYDLYFVPPANDDFCMLTFDLLNFNPYDAAHAELCLEMVLVERFRLDTLDESTTITWTYDFEMSQEFWSSGDGTLVFSDPEFFWDEGALHLRSRTNTNTFGYWHNDPIDIIIEEDRLYRGTFEVRTDVTDRTRVPQLRLRFNTANLQAARTLEISSIGDGANSPGTTNTTYDRLYFLPPANCVGKGLIVSFDILNFSPDDAPEASLILDRAIIETIEPPALP